MKNTSSLKCSNDFSRIYKNSKFYVGKFLVLYYTINDLDENRIGIVVTKKIGNSVKRNRIRRLIRENYRLLEDEVRIGYDIVFVSRKNQDIPDFHKIQKEVKYLLKRLSILK